MTLELAHSTCPNIDYRETKQNEVQGKDMCGVTLTVVVSL